MRLKTILNKCCRFKFFVFTGARFNEKDDSIIINVLPRSNSKPICSKCGMEALGYYVAPKPHYFEFIPFWGFHVYFEYRMTLESHC